MSREPIAPMGRGIVPYAITIFLGAFLLFLVQPLIGKFILPWFGGTPGVWTTCLLFFQCMLLAGYAYAHCLNYFLPVRKQVLVHGVLLFLVLISLPITPSDSLKPDGEESPVMAILTLLSLSIGLPYLALSATGPLVQAWYSKAHPDFSPYRLYALSNAGSLLALVVFPFVVEPWTTRTFQVTGWSWAMVFYVIFCGLLAWTLRNINEPEQEKLSTESREVQPFQKYFSWVFWLALPACATALLMATTNKMCQDVAVVPFLWVLPLALYLISFIISFDSPKWYSREFYLPMLVLCWGSVLWVIAEGVDVHILLQVIIYCTALFVSCMICHGELFRLRPQSSRLTQYYLGISAGGAIGGFAVAVLAPQVLNGYWEYHVSIWLVGLLFLLMQSFVRDVWMLNKWHVRGVLFVCWVAVGFVLLGYTNYGTWTKCAFILVPFFLGVGLSRLILAKWYYGRKPSEGIDFRSSIAAVILVLIAIFWCLGMMANLNSGNWKGWVSELNPGIWIAAVLFCLNLFVWLSLRNWEGKRIAWGWCGLILGPALLGLFLGLYKDYKDSSDGSIYMDRNFYGTIKIGRYLDDWDEPYRLLLNGRITHGYQYENQYASDWITTYYTYGSGIELAIRLTPDKAKRVGVVGLGVGTIAGYAQKGDFYCMYDINPAVVNLSADEQMQFTYCFNARARGAQVEIVEGDARLAMEREFDSAKSRQFDVLALDAFSSDSIPVHLLTREAMEIYGKHLKKDGVLAIHISNRYLDLEPVVRRLAKELSYKMILIDSSDGEDVAQDWVYSATWILLSRSQEFMDKVKANGEIQADLSEVQNLPLWTDDYASIFRIIRKPDWLSLWMEGGQ